MVYRGSVCQASQPVIQFITIMSKPYVSRYVRKENYESLNYPSPQPFSPHHAQPQNNDLSAQKRTLQQRQIEDLEQKVDIILQHNQKLAAQNAELKRRLAETQMIGLATVQKERMSRYQIEDSENAIRRMRAELQIKARQCQVLACECEAVRQAGRRQADGLRLVITNLTASLDESKLESLKLQQEAAQVKQQAESDKKLALRDLERRLQEQFSRSERERAEEAARDKAQHVRLMDQLCAKFEQERSEWVQRKNALVSKLQETHNREISELRQEMGQQFQIQLAKLAEEATERCRNQREKAEKFIKESLQGLGAAGQAEAESLRKQINALQISLDHRRKLIHELTSSELDRMPDREGLAETLLIRQRLKEQVENLLRENETLKIKTAQKHDRDLKEMVRVYEDKLDVLTAQNQWLSEQNGRLRSNYQAEVEAKIKQRRAWQVQAGQLRNLVRKLKVELKGIEEEFKLNIDGIRDQNLTFSMSIMKSMVQDRDKASFFEDQNRKLRALYQRHEADVQQQKKQAQDRVAFYQNKYEQLKQSLQAERKDLQQKEQLLQRKLEERQRAINEANHVQREHLEQLMAEWEGEKQQAEQQLIDARERAQAREADLKEAREEIEILRSKLKENGQHIERLRMELEMAGVNDHEKDDAVNHWKQHYEGIILKLQGDKRELKTILDSNNAKIEQLVYRYKTLQNELQKATLALSRRSQLDTRVIQLGMDHNLIKNMAQVWNKTSE